MKAGIKDESNTTSYRELNHHHALGKQKFSFEHAARLRIDFNRIIQPVPRDPDDFITAEDNWAFHAVGPGYVVINKIFF